MPNIGEIVNYQPPVGTGADKPLAAIIIGLNQNPDSADLHVYNGYCQGEMDVPKVLASESGDPEPGRYTPLPASAPASSSKHHKHGTIE